MDGGVIALGYQIDSFQHNSVVRIELVEGCICILWGNGCYIHKAAYPTVGDELKSSFCVDNALVKMFQDLVWFDMDAAF